MAVCWEIQIRVGKWTVDVWFVHLQVVTDLANAADRSESKLPDRKSELCVLRDTLNAKTEQEEKDEKKMLDRDADDIGEGSARGTVMLLLYICPCMFYGIQ